MAMMTWTCRVSFTKLLGDIKCLFPSHHNTHTQLEDLYTYCKATAFLYILEFCDQVLHFLQVYWRILHPTISFKLLAISHVLGFVQKEGVSTKSRPIGNWRNDSIVGKYFGIDQVWVRFLVLVISWFWLVILRSGDLKITWWEAFLISQQIIMSIYFLQQSSLFGDLFMSSRFTCNLT